jgi:hypothetical protein
MENEKQQPQSGSATDHVSIRRNVVNNIDVFRHRCVTLAGWHFLLDGKSVELGVSPAHGWGSSHLIIA